MSSLCDDSGLVHAITFDNLNIFSKPVGFSYMKCSGMISGANLVTVERVSGDKLTELIFKGLS